jgi:hypothetical protein
VLADVGQVEPDEIFFVALDTLLRHAVPLDSSRPVGLPTGTDRTAHRGEKQTLSSFHFYFLLQLCEVILSHCLTVTFYFLQQ